MAKVELTSPLEDYDWDLYVRDDPGRHQQGDQSSSVFRKWKGTGNPGTPWKQYGPTVMTLLAKGPGFFVRRIPNPDRADDDDSDDEMPDAGFMEANDERWKWDDRWREDDPL